MVWADGRGMTTTHSLPLSGGDVGMCRNMESIGGVDEVTSKMAPIHRAQELDGLFLRRVL